MYAFTSFNKKERKQFVQDFVDGKVYTSQMIPDEHWDALIPVVFLPIGLGAFKDTTPHEAAHIGIIFEYLNKAGARLNKGYPTFLSMQVLDTYEWKNVSSMIVEELGKKENNLEVKE